jgi:hypothetical protein
MSVRCLYLVAFAFFLTSGLARASDAAGEEDEVPVVGRPAGLPFSGASGTFSVEAEAEPTSLRAEKPITYKVIVRAIGPVRRPPRRPDLQQLPAFKDRFYIEVVDPGGRPADSRTWEFIYRLKPRRVDVVEIPALPFVYFNPLIRPAIKGFQISYTDAIPLKIMAPEEYVPLPALSVGVYQLATGPAVFAHHDRLHPPGIATLVLFIVGPPLLCGAYYLVWRIRHPDAGRKIRKRRSRAADESLRQLRNARRLPMPQRASQTADALTRYLHDRFDLAVVDPTPAEAAGAMRRAGCGVSLAVATARVIAACDAVRFAPAADGATLNGEAERLILDVEAETWSSHHS